MPDRPVAGQLEERALPLEVDGRRIRGVIPYGVESQTYYAMVDPIAFREGVGRLLAEVQRIKSEGDYAAARDLFDTYGVHFDPALRDEVVARVDRLNMPSYTGFVQPKLEARKANDGAIEDVLITYPLDLTAQMLEYSGRKIPD